jgi:two-component system, LytTR family, sensor kinase
MDFKRSNLKLSVFFWLAYFAYEWLSQATIACEYERFLINAAVIVPITFVATWFTIHVLIKQFFLKKRLVEFWVGFVLSAILFTVLRRAFNYYYTYPLYWPNGQQTPFIFFPKMTIEMVNIYLIAALYTMFYFMRDWYEQQRLSQELQRDKVEAQLQLLKSQVQPHFIFNTLNNIYSLSLKNNPKTPDLIYRLSSLLSYMLYDSRQDTIPVQKEMEYIHNYIELEKIRYGERLDVAVNCFDTVDKFFIPPFLLLPLVENSFKHGVSNDVGASWIRIDVSVKDDWLTVKIENSRVTDNHNGNGHHNGQLNGNGHTNSQAVGYNGIGLQNVKQRLEILYPDRHDFKHLSEGQSFLTVLKLKNRQS